MSKVGTSQTLGSLPVAQAPAITSYPEPQGVLVKLLMDASQAKGQRMVFTLRLHSRASATQYPDPVSSS